MTTDDPRIGDLLGAKCSTEEQARVALLGFPSDLGVRRNKGREGARFSPSAIRELFYSMRPDVTCCDDFEEVLSYTIDLGDLPIEEETEKDHTSLGKEVGRLLEKGILPIVLGGGHDTSYGHFLGYVNQKRSVSILNWDAHADVKRKIDGQRHSGSPFRDALEHPSGLCEHYTVAGLFRHNISRENYEFLQHASSSVFWNEQVELGTLSSIYATLPGDYLATFDLDALDPAYAPGVSARSPSSGGMKPEAWLLAARMAGADPHCTSFDIVELNPRFDQDDHTSRLAAFTLWHFFRGLVDRLSA